MWRKTISPHVFLPLPCFLRVTAKAKVFHTDNGGEDRTTFSTATHPILFYMARPIEQFRSIPFNRDHFFRPYRATTR
uniref:Putative secreted protein n=1 Tax=Anopheles marajoara TaxID=58244 RepID=A0A2M4CCE6_9DIPT